ncbi:MAG: flagellar biosynthesis protein FlhA [Gemmatimonadota bacterium]|nr:flagellar biosynthesis protein FlhA [Gemmatimonadota bacterium]MDH5758224.1 flagellar biosynthesis protein FlhA [Gemmatimonadota bacterium]
MSDEKLPPAESPGFLVDFLIPDVLRKQSEVLVIIGIVFVVGLLVLPLPGFLLDLFLALSIASSLVVLLVALYADRPLDFSSFPAMLLLLTLYRLALNVSSTRLILGTGEAGKVIESFGEFVIGGNYAVGVVIFLILVGINFIVITKGAGRVAEVAARFTLDAMPGRQMSIDGDLSAGLIDDAEAKRRREEVSQEADFYGAMDGSAKFVRGDAIAGLLITAINILGGLFVGVIQRGMPVTRALSEYTILTVGDGLVSQIPALVISTAAGIMVTSSSGGGRVATAVVRQVGREAKPMWIASGFLGALALVPGMPSIPFLALSGGAALAARTSAQNKRDRIAARDAAAALPVGGGDAPAAERSPVHDLLQIDPVELEIGYGLIALVDEKQGGDLLERIRLLRKQAALELGILVPPIRIRDDVRLPPNEYVMKIRGTEVARGEVMPRLLMALDTGSVLEEIEGELTFDPSFGMPAKWIPQRNRVDAEASGYVVVEPSTVVATHLMETLKTHGSDLLGRQDVQEMLDTLKQSYPALVDEVVPARVPLGVLHRVLQRLLKERVPIRDMVTILETLADVSEHTKDAEALTEHVRRALANVIGERFVGLDGAIRGITLGPRLEAALMGLFSPRANRAPTEMMDPDTLTSLLGRLDDLSRAYAEDGRPAPIITPPGLRVGVRRLIEPVLPNVPVISLAELPAQANLRSVATWEMLDAA